VRGNGSIGVDGGGFDPGDDDDELPGNGDDVERMNASYDDDVDDCMFAVFDGTDDDDDDDDADDDNDDDDDDDDDDDAGDDDDDDDDENDVNMRRGDDDKIGRRREL
jgi:hypothetical protein